MAGVNWRSLGTALGASRLLGAILACAALSLVVHSGHWSGAEGSWCLFAWALSFSVTAVVLLVELAGAQARSPVPWREGPPAAASTAALLCLSASVVYPLWFLVGWDNGRRGHQVAACVCSCLATVAYAAEVWLSRARPGETTGYMATTPGRLKVLECFIACVIFIFVSDVDYTSYGALQWCLAVYSICFILSFLAAAACLTGSTGRLPVSFPRFVAVCAMLGALMYATAAVIWPVFNFDKRYGTPSRPAQCQSMNTRRCSWDSALAVAILSCANLLAYLADLVYSGRIVFIRS